MFSVSGTLHLGYPKVFLGRIDASYVDATYFEPIRAQKWPLLAVIGQKMQDIGFKSPKIMFLVSGTLQLGYQKCFLGRIDASYVDAIYF